MMIFVKGCQQSLTPLTFKSLQLQSLKFYTNSSFLAPFITRLNHIAIATNDATDQRTFYGSILKLPVSERLLQKEHGVYTTFIDIGNTKLELLEPFGETSPIANFLTRNPKGGVNHICYEVRDLNAIMEHLAKMGIRPLSEPKIGAHGNPVIFLHPKDCHGILVELEEVSHKTTGAHK